MTRQFLKTHYQSVIFDLDGVLADTEPLNFRAIQDMFDPQFLRVDHDDYLALYGLDYHDSAQYLKRRYHLEEPVESLMRRQQACALHRIDVELEPAPGARELIQWLVSKKIAVGLASNSPSRYVAHVLDRLGVASFIPYPVGREDVDRGKPAPDPYLEACARLKRDPRQSLAVEDSTVGMQSALAAGMSVALVGPHAPPPSERVIRCETIMQLASSLQAE